MTTDVATRFMAVRYGIPLEADEKELLRLGIEAVAADAAADGYLVVTKPVVTMREPSVYVDTGETAGWLPVGNTAGHIGVGGTMGDPHALTVVWEADVIPSPEAVPVLGVQEADGTVMVHVPEVTTRIGGAVRAVHNLGTPVVITAFRDNGQPIGYLAATEIDPAETEVQVHPGTSLLTVRARPGD